MRHVVTTVIVIPIVSMVLGGAGATPPAPPPGSTPPGASLADLAWMSGSWSSTREGKLSEEHWTRPAGGLMLGVHRDLEGATAAFEFLRIEQSGGAITYLASPQGRPATPFPLVESSKERAVFANPEHDFPKKIVYWREGASLCAAIEGPMNGQTVSERWCWEPASLR